jgi:D-glycero-D-manno-heptose 1,7-bisphosphate phosphatase
VVIDSAITRRAVYLDRDGVLNRAIVRAGKPYPPGMLDELEILPGVPEALAQLRAAGHRLVVVTNQPDVGRGTMARETVEATHEYIVVRLPLDAIEVCLHAEADRCNCREPKPGMLVRDGTAHGVDLHRSFMVGTAGATLMPAPRRVAGPF